MNKEISTGKAPKEVLRVDAAERGVKNSQIHVHFKDNTGLNIDGTIHKAKNGIPTPSRGAIRWLQNYGWNI